MAQTDRSRLKLLIWIYAAVALCWFAFARWVVPTILVVENPGPILAAFIYSIQGPPALFYNREVLVCWREFSWAALVALAMQLSIVLILRRYDWSAAQSRSPAEMRAEWRMSLWLLVLSFVFLAVTVVAGVRHDYYFHLAMWYEVQQGHDPWFIVYGANGAVPLNAYGPLFNLIAGLAWVNRLAPKLLFGYAYILFAIAQVKGFMARRPSSALQMITLTALFWNPFPWVEIAIRGHFDILVALLCLGAIQAWGRRNDTVSGTYLAAGILLKYFPVVLVPFLALDHGRVRARFLVVALALITLGMGLSCYWWGLSALSPLTFAATRTSTTLSIFWFLRGRYSPLSRFVGVTSYDYLAPYAMILALFGVWSWSRARHPSALASAAAATMTMVLFHRTGYPQYHMVPFVLGATWVVQDWDRLMPQTGAVFAIASYFVWIAAFDLYYAFINDESGAYHWIYVRDAVGLPTFIFGCAFVIGMMRASTPRLFATVEGK